MSKVQTISIQIDIPTGAWNLACDAESLAERMQIVLIAISLLSDYAKSMEDADVNP